MDYTRKQSKLLLQKSYKKHSKPLNLLQHLSMWFKTGQTI